MRDLRKPQRFASEISTEECYGTRVLAMNTVRDNDTHKTGLNNNDLIIGISGSGKTSGYVIPNLCTIKHSLVVADAKSQLHKKFRRDLENRGFEVHLIDFVRPENSEAFNPLDGIRRKKEKYRDKDGTIKVREGYNRTDVRKLVNTMITGEITHDKFWVDAPRNLLVSLIAYVLEVLPPEEQHMGSVFKVYRRLIEEINDYRAKKSDNKGSDVSIPLFDELEVIDPSSFAVSVFSICKGTIPAETTWGCIMQAVTNVLEIFNYPEYDKLFNGTSCIDFAELGRKRMVIFLNVSDTEHSMDPIVNTFYSVVLQKLVEEADSRDDGRLQVPVRIILDDFASNVFIEDFDKLISVIRSREIYVSVIIQSVSQLEGMYGNAKANTIEDNCDTTIFLGGGGPGTAEYISRRMDLPSSYVEKLNSTKLVLLTRGKGHKVLEKIKSYEMDPEELAKVNSGIEA